MKQWVRMGSVAAVVAAMVLGTLSIAQEGGAAVETTASTNDGVFTAEQALRGRQPFMQNCAACHGDDLVSVDPYAPDLTGPTFNNRWIGSTVGERFETIRTTMPLGRGGLLEDATYVDIVAFVLSENKYPAGESELPADLDVLNTILIEAR